MPLVAVEKSRVYSNNSQKILKDRENKVEAKKKLLGFFFSCRFSGGLFCGCCGFCGFFHAYAFSCTFSYCTKFSDGCVCSSCKCVVAFAALPYADAFAVYADKAALWASVGFFEFSYDFNVAFSDCGSVTCP